MPVVRRGISSPASVASERTGVASEAMGERREAVSVGAECCESAFQAPQEGHCPCHLGVESPQRLHTYTSRALAMNTPDEEC